MDDPQSRHETGGRRADGTFAPGFTGNPGGRPKGLVRRIREDTGDGGEPAAFMLRVFRDEGEPTKTRMQAADWLADRGFGKPAVVLDAEVRPPPPPDMYSQMSDEELEARIQELKAGLEPDHRPRELTETT